MNSFRNWALILSFAITWPARAREYPLMKAYPPPPRLEKLALPDGRLEEIAISRISAAFIDMDSIDLKDNQATIVAYIVVNPGISVGGAIVSQYVSLKRYDCRTNRLHDFGQKGYDQEGSLAIYTDRQDKMESFELNSLNFLFKTRACSKEIFHHKILIGHKAAFDDGQREILSLQNQQR